MIVLDTRGYTGSIRYRRKLGFAAIWWVLC